MKSKNPVFTLLSYTASCCKRPGRLGHAGSPGRSGAAGIADQDLRGNRVVVVTELRGKFFRRRQSKGEAEVPSRRIPVPFDRTPPPQDEAWKLGMILTCPLSVSATPLPLIRRPRRQAAYTRREIDQQLRQVPLRVYVVAATSAGQAG
jgi:hypothetical protein